MLFRVSSLQDMRFIYLYVSWDMESTLLCCIVLPRLVLGSVWLGRKLGRGSCSLSYGAPWRNGSTFRILSDPFGLRRDFWSLVVFSSQGFPPWQRLPMWLGRIRMDSPPIGLLVEIEVTNKWPQFCGNSCPAFPARAFRPSRLKLTAWMMWSTQLEGLWSYVVST